MKHVIVSSHDLSPKTGLRAQDYIDREEVIKDETWDGLGAVIRQCHRTAAKSGWWDKYMHDGFMSASARFFGAEIIGSKLMLKVTELSEALEEVRGKAPLQEVYYSGESGLATFKGSYKEVQTWLEEQGEKSKPKPEGVPVELADAVIRIFDFCAFFGIDLVGAIRMKMAYNEGRPYRHGGKTI